MYVFLYLLGELDYDSYLFGDLLDYHHIKSTFIVTFIGLPPTAVAVAEPELFASILNEKNGVF